MNPDWPEGQRFRVIADGCWLSGWVMHPDLRNVYQGWRHDLAVGDVITCLGADFGFGSDPGYGIHWTNDAVKTARAMKVEFKPSIGSIFSYRPKDDCLEPVTAD